MMAVVRHKCARRDGFVLMLLVMSMAVLIGSIGLALDVGRLSIVRDEAQTFADMSALSAARELDGSFAGIDRAREGVTRSPMRWDMGAKPFSGTIVEFSHNNQNWTPTPTVPMDVRFVRVTVDLKDVDLFFLPVVTGQRTARVRVNAVAGQQTQNSAMLPFAIEAHDANAKDFGFRPGNRVALDHYIQEPTLEGVADSIENGHSANLILPGKPVPSSDVVPTLQLASLRNRAGSDSNISAASYVEYQSAPGNGRRVGMVTVVAPGDLRALGFATVFLDAAPKSLEAEYIAPAAAVTSARLFQ